MLDPFFDEPPFPTPMTDTVTVTAVTGVVVSKRLPLAKRGWFAVAAARISMTSDVLSQIKIVKMMGLQNVMTNALQKMRVDELRESRKSRFWLVMYLVLSTYDIAPSLICLLTLSSHFVRMLSATFGTGCSFVLDRPRQPIYPPCRLYCPCIFDTSGHRSGYSPLNLLYDGERVR